LKGLEVGEGENECVIRTFFLLTDGGVFCDGSERGEVMRRGEGKQGFGGRMRVVRGGGGVFPCP